MNWYASACAYSSWLSGQWTVLMFMFMFMLVLIFMLIIFMSKFLFMFHFVAAVTMNEST